MRSFGLQRLLAPLAVLAIILITSSSGLSQAFRGSIHGSVLDSSGAAVGDAAVTATHDATGVRRSITTSSAGEYSFPNLPLGIYTVTSTKAGFQEAQRTKIEVVVSTVTTVDIALSVATQATAVDVKADAPLVETTSTAVTGVVDQNIVKDLPLNGRDSASTVLQVGYVGSLGRALPITVDINAAVPGAGSVQSRRPYNTLYPTLGPINELQSVASSNFHSLQTSLQQKLWRGLTGKVAYTWGHAIDDASDARSYLPANSYNLHSERGNATFDIRHNFVAMPATISPRFQAFHALSAADGNSTRCSPRRRAVRSISMPELLPVAAAIPAQMRAIASI